MVTNNHINSNNNYNDDDDDDDNKCNSNGNLKVLTQEPHCSSVDLPLGSNND